MFIFQRISVPDDVISSFKEGAYELQPMNSYGLKTAPK